MSLGKTKKREPKNKENGNPKKYPKIALLFGYARYHKLTKSPKIRLLTKVWLQSIMNENIRLRAVRTASQDEKISKSSDSQQNQSFFVAYGEAKYSVPLFIRHLP